MKLLKSFESKKEICFAMPLCIRKAPHLKGIRETLVSLAETCSPIFNIGWRGKRFTGDSRRFRWESPKSQRLSQH